jgi:hypothetical protein
MTAMVFNLVNNVAGTREADLTCFFLEVASLCSHFMRLFWITGAGILSLSAGQAAGTGWIPAIAISVVLGLISAKTFAMVGEACDMLGESDFKVR